MIRTFSRATWRNENDHDREIADYDDAIQLNGLRSPAYIRVRLKLHNNAEEKKWSETYINGQFLLHR